MTLKELRTSKGFKTQQELAERLNIKRSTVNKWEKGQFPQVETLLELKKVFAVTTDYIIDTIINSKTKNFIAVDNEIPR